MASIDDEEHYREYMRQEDEMDRVQDAWERDQGIKRTASVAELRDLRRYKGALEMIARHPCHASDRARPDWHCGECASCVARGALKGED